MIIFGYNWISNPLRLPFRHLGTGAISNEARGRRPDPAGHFYGIECNGKSSIRTSIDKPLDPFRAACSEVLHKFN